jgi:hypothetical protein
MNARTKRIINELNKFMRHSVTSWPVEQVPVCRCCQASMRDMTNVVHRDSCVISKLIVLLEPE